eukprot:5242807-Heterocapsa_arctica.AAC.1
MDDMDDKVREARGMLLPTPPSAVELERHSLTHVPYAPWCSTCVKSRGRDDAHRQLKRRQGPEV